MSRFNTGNPLGSGSPLDLDDNAKNMDLAVNSDGDTFQDRMGRSRLTWAGIVRSGTGDPAIAVDAAARAEAAASSVEQNAEQIAQDAAQQAVDNVVIAVDGAVDRAEMEADRAEAAADSAFVSADVYPDVAAGLDAVEDGEQFQVIVGAEAIRYVKESASTATPVARYPASALVKAIYAHQLNDAPSSVATYPYGALMDSSGGAALDLAQGQFADGTSGLLLTSTNSLNKWADSLFTLPSTVSEDQIYILEALLAEKTDSGSTYGIGLATGIPGTNYNAAFYRGAGNLYFDGDTLTEFGGSALYPFDEGDTIGLGLLLKADGRMFAFRVAPDGTPTEFVQVPAGFVTSGPVKIAVRRSGKWVIRVRKLSTGAPLQLAALTVASEGEYSTPLHSIVNSVTSMVEDQWGGWATTLSVSSTVPAGFDETVRFSTSIVQNDNSQVYGVGIDAELSDAHRVVVRTTMTKKNIVSFTPAVGLAFGDSSSVRVAFFRTTGQFFVTTVTPTSIVLEPDPYAIPPASPLTFDEGDTLTMEYWPVGQEGGRQLIAVRVTNQHGQSTGTCRFSVDSTDKTVFCVRSSATFETSIFTASRPAVSSGGGAGTAGVVYVDHSMGDDENPGTRDDPVATIGKGLELAGTVGIVEIAGGEYREKLTIGAGDLWLRARANERVSILGSDRLTLTKTSGRAVVYQSALASKPTGMGGSRGPAMIFEWGTPSREITPEDRHDLQRGEAFRLPYTEMLEAESIAALDDPSGYGMWYWEDGVIYLSATDGGDATDRRYEVRQREVLSQSSGSIRLTRIDSYFSSNYGMDFHDSVIVERDDCRAFGAYSNGFRDGANVIVSRRDEAAGNGNDGFNGTSLVYLGTPNRSVVNNCVYFDPWGHDNYDDGFSYHQRGEGSIFGGLFEHNSKAGVVHVSGASFACYNTISRYADHGFQIATAPDDERVTSVFRLHNTLAYGNTRNYRARNGALMLAFDCVSGSGTIGYDGGDGEIVARNCKQEQGSVTTVRTGSVTVINDGLLE